MNPGSLNRQITIQTLVIDQSSGHDVESWSEAQTIRANVTQTDGSRFVNDDELKDKVVYKIICWDNNYSDNIRIGLGDLNLFPVRPIIKNPGKSNLNEAVIYACAKTSSVLLT